MRLLPASREILRVLAICPWIPVDVLAVLTGARSRASVYQALARLAAAGLVQKRQVSLGLFASSRPAALWATTTPRQDARQATGCTALSAVSHGSGPKQIGSRSLRPNPHPADPVRIAAARALAGWLAAKRGTGQALKIVAWQAPLIQRPAALAGRRLRVPAVAAFESADPNAGLQRIIVVPDLATAPIARLRRTLLGLFESFAHTRADGDGHPARLLISTTDLDGAGARRLAWLQLLRRLQTDTGVPALTVDVLDWPQVYRLLGVHVPPHGRVDRRPGPRGRRAHEMLDLLGRHPFLTIKQLADLLALTPRRARQLRQSLVEQGLLRLLPASDLGPSTPVRVATHCAPAADLAELTASGRLHMARRLGLPVSDARRYQGLFGGSAQYRKRALRHLAHTIGANQVFVSLAVSARAARKHGADEALEEWRPAAACENWRCKPDGYGCYRRGDQRFGFLLEYDRGTERAAQYDAKLAAYYAYYRGGQAARRYAGFPRVLFVTTSQAAEARIGAAIKRAVERHGNQGFSFLTTTTTRIGAAGIHAAIWRDPAATGQTFRER